MNAPTPPVKYFDRITVMTCARKLRMTKTHRRTAGGSWDTTPYPNTRWYSARVEEVGSFGDLVRLMTSLESRARDFIIRDVAHAHTTMGDCRRAMDFFGPQQVGLRTLGVDVDDLMVADVMGVESIDPSSRESLEGAIEMMIRDRFPVELQNASVAYQWSSSAGVKPWTQYRLHLWWFLDRPVFRGSLKRWAKTVDGVDASFFDSVRVNYTARPVFLGRDGVEVSDIMGSDSQGSLRSGVIRRSSDVATAPSTWLNRTAHDTLLKHEALEREDERRAAAASQRRSMASPIGREQFKSRAEAYLNAIIISIVRDLPGTGRYPHVRSKVRSAFGLRDVIDAHEIAAKLRPECERAFTLSGRTDKSARGEASRLIGPLIIDAKNAAPARPLPTSDRDRVDGSRSKATAPVVTKKKPTLLAGAWVTDHVDYPPQEREPGTPWEAPAEGWQDKNASPITLDSARAWLDIATLTSIERGGSHTIAAPAGSGKSYAAKRRALIEFTQREDVKAQLAVPTIALAIEAADDLNTMAMLGERHGFRAVVSSSRRGPNDDHGQTCYRYDEVNDASSISPTGAIKVCRGCKFHPRNAPTRQDCCPFYRSVIGEQSADVVVKTHARYILEGMDTENAPTFAMTVLDEDPSGAMIHSGSIGATDLISLMASDDVKIDRATLGDLTKILADSLLKPIKTKDLAAQVDATTIKVRDHYQGGDAAVDRALKIEDIASRRAVMRSAVPWRTIAGLADAVAAGWGATEIKDGRLLVTHTLPLPLATSGTIIHLDATSSGARSKALLGDAATFRRPRVEWPKHVTVSWIPIDAGARSRLHRIESEGARRVPLIWNAAVETFGGKGSLVVTSMRNTREELWTGQVLAALRARGTDVIYHKGPGGRGMNKFKDHHTIIVDPWHIPKHVIRQSAYAWCQIAGEDWTEKATRTKWKIEAKAQLVSAEILQEIARIRPLSATAEKPKKIVILDRRDPRSLGLPLDEVIDPDLLVWEAFGTTTGIDTAPSLAAAAVAAAGGCYMPTIDLRSVAPMRPCDISGAAPSSETPERQYKLSDVLDSCLKDERSPYDNVGLIMNTWSRHHGGWGQLAERGLVALAVIETDKGGHKLPMLYRGRVSRSTLERWLRSVGVKRYRVDGEKTWHNAEDIDDETAGAILALEVNDATQVEAPAVYAAIIRDKGCSESTARRTIERLAAPDETATETCRRLWIELQGVKAVEVARIVADRQDVTWFEATQIVTQKIGIRLAVWRSGEKRRE